jgi:hypothetical protein
MENKPEAKKLEYIIDQPIDVDGHTTTLRVKGVLKVDKATWEVSTKLTTKMADPANEDATNAVIETAAQNLAAMIEKMIQERQNVLQPEAGDKSQLNIDFTAPVIEKKNFAGQEEEAEPQPAAG